MNSFPRRDFLKSSAALASSLACSPSLADGTSSPSTTEINDDVVRFFAIGDTHYFANEQSPSELMESSILNCHGLIDTLNALPNTEIPAEAGGGRVGTIQGVIHAGDIIDTGDKRGAVQSKMQQREWEGFNKDFGLNGTEGRLKYPVYEVHGNHDSPSGDGLAIDGLIERTKARQVLARSANGLHYSWDFGPVHCINLGIVVGHDLRNEQRRRYNPMDSLEFLIGDLQQHAADANRPVLLTHHIDLPRYSKPCELTNEANLAMEWNPCDVAAYYEAIRKYNIIAILYGHTHVRNIQLWNGTPEKTNSGIPLLNIDNSSHFSGGNQAFFYIEIDSQEMRIRECGTKDSWSSHFWTPNLWKFPTHKTV